MRQMTLITAFGFLLAVPRGFSPLYEMFIIALLCLMTLYLSIYFYVNGQAEIALISFIIAVFYNPYFMLVVEPDRSPVLDSAAALTYFLIALSWNSLSTLQVHQKEKDHVQD